MDKQIRVWNQYDPEDYFNRYKLSNNLQTPYSNSNDTNFSFYQNQLGLVNLKDNGDEFIIEVLASGLKIDEIEIEYYDDEIKIESSPQGKEDDNVDTIMNEFQIKPFKRYIRVGSQIDHDNIIANLNDGILKVTLPKKRSGLRKKIKVN